MEQIIAFILMLVLQFFGAAATPPPADPTDAALPLAAQSGIVVSVTDGDTIVVELDGVREIVRYIGIDTPEPYRDGKPACYSSEATARNQALVGGQQVMLVADREDRDRYDRLLRYVYVEGVFVNEVLVEEGFAVVLPIKPNTAYAEVFATAARTAQAAGAGLWGSCKAGDSVTSDTIATAEPAAISADQLTDGQRRLLEFLRIDTTTFIVTKAMVQCAEAAVGVDRLAEIISGGVPSVKEGFALYNCYQS